VDAEVDISSMHYVPYGYAAPAAAERPSSSQHQHRTSAAVGARPSIDLLKSITAAAIATETAPAASEGKEGDDNDDTYSSDDFESDDEGQGAGEEKDGILYNSDTKTSERPTGLGIADSTGPEGPQGFDPDALEAIDSLLDERDLLLSQHATLYNRWNSVKRVGAAANGVDEYMALYRLEFCEGRMKEIDSELEALGVDMAALHRDSQQSGALQATTEEDYSDLSLSGAQDRESKEAEDAVAALEDHLSHAAIRR
jgi:hypothetical protein